MNYCHRTNGEYNTIMTSNETLAEKERSMNSYEEPDGYRVETAGNKVSVSFGGRSFSFSLSAAREYSMPVAIAKSLKGLGKNPAEFVAVTGASSPLRRGAWTWLQPHIDQERQKQAASEAAKRDALLKILPGLDKLEAAYESRARYNAEFNRMMEDEDNDGVRPPSATVPDIGALEAQHPAAAAYLRCEEIAHCSHWASGKGPIYERGAERIASGEDWEAVMREADSEWSDVASRAANNM